jgi:deoxyribodipyrimidine photo-lyase
VKIKESRIEKINEVDLNNGDFTAYWMQSAQRFNYNHAFNYAVSRANHLNQPLLIFFLVDKNYPEAKYGHFEFMFDGLKDLQQQAKDFNLNFHIFEYDNKNLIKDILEGAGILISEKVYLKNLRNWKQEIAEIINIPFYTIETNLICPVEEVSEKEEYAAYTIRKKINKIKEEYLNDLAILDLKNKSKIKVNKKAENKIIKNLDDFINTVDFEDKRSFKNFFSGGYIAAENKLNDFIDNKLQDYDEKRNFPHLDYQSDLSPYLHFGQLSSLQAALAAINSPEDESGFIEELLIRRELSYNFIYYNENYDMGLKEILPDWAYTTLKEHASDQREYQYSYQEFDNYNTHDEYWNAAQKELKLTGKMHNYMRMYWGKKILEWVGDPEEAYRIALKLNNKYALDGRDANSYAGVSWCFGKHDRAWKERKIYGKVRYMNANGLERKFEMEKYIEKVKNLG